MLKVVFQVSAMELKSRLELTEIFCDVDDFYRSFERYCRSTPQLTVISGEKRCRSRMSLSEVMTIVIAFHGSGYRSLVRLTSSNQLRHWALKVDILTSFISKIG